MLTGAGYRALFVGGSVRNALLGAAVTDVDIATDARPENVIMLAEEAGLKAVPTGIDHGTVTVVAGGVAHEVTTFRRDVESFGRHATVAFSDDLAEDAARRDFTMNALYATPEGEVIDPLGGLPDLLARRVRFVGDPVARITEDTLRILRFFRFYAWYGDPGQGIDAEGLAACAALAEGVQPLSRERVGAEMRKLLSAPDPAAAVAAMAGAGVLARVLPGSDARALAVLVHLEGDVPLRWLRRLAVLGGTGVAKDCDCRGARRGSWPVAGRCEGTARSGRELAIATGRRWPMISCWCAAPARDDRRPGCGMRRKRGGGGVSGARPDCPGYSGEALGRRLAELEARWIASGFQLNRDALWA